MTIVRTNDEEPGVLSTSSDVKRGRAKRKAQCCEVDVTITGTPEVPVYKVTCNGNTEALTKAEFDAEYESLSGFDGSENRNPRFNESENRNLSPDEPGAKNPRLNDPEAPHAENKHLSKSRRE